jgi:hypothetical protein
MEVIKPPFLTHYLNLHKYPPKLFLSPLHTFAMLVLLQSLSFDASETDLNSVIKEATYTLSFPNKTNMFLDLIK